MKKAPYNIYQSRWHIAITIGLLIVPLLFLLAFSQYAKIDTQRLFSDLSISFVRLLVAYFFAAILAWAGAISFYRGRRAMIALPIFDVLQSFPTFAALPLATYFWGPSSETVVVFLVLTIIWPIFFSLVSSLKLVRKDWEEAAAIAGLRGFDYIRRFLWPISLPGLITGSIIGLGEGWEALVATEIITGVKMGLGTFFSQYSQVPAITALGILSLLLFIFSINKVTWLPLLEWSHNRMEE